MITGFNCPCCSTWARECTFKELEEDAHHPRCPIHNRDKEALRRVGQDELATWVIALHDLLIKSATDRD